MKVTESQGVGLVRESRGILLVVWEKGVYPLELYNCFDDAEFHVVWRVVTRTLCKLCCQVLRDIFIPVAVNCAAVLCIL